MKNWFENLKLIFIKKYGIIYMVEKDYFYAAAPKLLCGVFCVVRVLYKGHSGGFWAKVVKISQLTLKIYDGTYLEEKFLKLLYIRL